MKNNNSNISKAEATILLKALAYYCLHAPMNKTKSAMKLMKKLTDTK